MKKKRSAIRFERNFIHAFRQKWERWPIVLSILWLHPCCWITVHLYSIFDVSFVVAKHVSCLSDVSLPPVV
jgi:hypothetical protein